MRRLTVLAVGLCLPLVLVAAEAQSRKKAAPTKRPPQTAAAKKTPVKKKSASSKKATSKSRSKKSRRASWRTGQRTPTPQRFAEIQQALIEKGYLQPPASGAWGAESIEALKRFQQDQNLTANGKLDALSLIALGLGASREPTNGGSPPPANNSSQPTRLP